MHIKEIKVNRIMLRDRGSSSEISIESNLIIQPDDPEADAIRQHVPENIQLNTTSPRLQAAVVELFAACQERVNKQHLPNKVINNG